MFETSAVVAVPFCQECRGPDYELSELLVSLNPFHMTTLLQGFQHRESKMQGDEVGHTILCRRTV
jgi:hypothetical protein